MLSTPITSARDSGQSRPATYTVTFARTLSLRLTVQNRPTYPIAFEDGRSSPSARRPIACTSILRRGAFTLEGR
jgi:hypothetical protein